MIEYQNYFKHLSIRYNNQFDNFENLEINSVRNRVWSGNLIRSAISILFERPIWITSITDNSPSIISNPTASNKEPLNICFNHNHYNSILKKSQFSFINTPFIIQDSDIKFNKTDIFNIFTSKKREETRALFKPYDIQKFFKCPRKSYCSYY